MQYIDKKTCKYKYTFIYKIDKITHENNNTIKHSNDILTIHSICIVSRSQCTYKS